MAGKWLASARQARRGNVALKKRTATSIHWEAVMPVLTATVPDVGAPPAQPAAATRSALCRPGLPGRPGRARRRGPEQPHARSGCLARALPRRPQRRIRARSEAVAAT